MAALAPSRAQAGPHTAARHEVASGERLALAFAVAFVAFFFAPSFLPYAFPLYPDMSWGDAVDLATPLVLIPLYWALFAAGWSPGRRSTVAFLVLAAAWVEGQGIHLAANSIGHLVEAGAGASLTHFYDEVFSHYLWHGALVALSALVVYGQLRARPASGVRPLALVAAALYALAFFALVVEGGTAPLGVGFAAAVTVWAAARGWRRALATPVLSVFTAGYPAALALFAAWFLMWGGRLPQFSEIGWIK